MASGPAVAQQVLQPDDMVAEPEAETVRRYAVELIVFEYNGDDAGTELFQPEVPPEELPGPDMTAGEEVPFYSDGTAALPDTQPDSGAPSMEAAIPAEIAVADAAEADRPFSPEELILNELPSSASINLKIMEPHEYSLDEVYAKLDELGAYTPLLRTGWIQDTVDEDQARALQLRRLGDPPLRLDGELTLYLGRYLHLVVDVTLEEMVEQAPATAVASDELPGRSAFEFDPYEAKLFIPVRYRIEEDRIVRNGELRYFDHPKFGVLARITRIEDAPGPEEPVPIEGNVVGSAQRDF